MKEPPPFADLVYVAEDGSLDYKGDDLREFLEFDRWLKGRACEHEGGVLLHYRIGNIDLVGRLREELQRQAGLFPVLLGKVLYSGAHAGDYLSAGDFAAVLGELDHLSDFPCANGADRQPLRNFDHKMRELVTAALAAGKPISF